MNQNTQIIRYILKTVETNNRLNRRPGEKGPNQSKEKKIVIKEGKTSTKNYSKRKKKKKTTLPKGILKVQSTFNNTIITISNLKGSVVGWSSAGVNGFKGARKSTAFAAKTTASIAAQKAIDKGLKRAKVLIKGSGPGRDNALRGLAEAGLDIAVIRDVTSLSHNGCRPRKKRRV